MSNGAVPNYLALADLLEISIATMNGGERLPSEHELAALHGVSRVTARAALQELERRHLVRRSKGSGTFVALRLVFAIHPDLPPSWSHTVRAAGGQPSTKAVNSTLTFLPADLAPGFRDLVAPGGSLHTILTSLGYSPSASGPASTCRSPTSRSRPTSNSRAGPEYGTEPDHRPALRPSPRIRPHWNRPDVFDMRMEYPRSPLGCRQAGQG